MGDPLLTHVMENGGFYAITDRLSRTFTDAFLFSPVEYLAQGFGKKGHIFPAAGEAHQPDPPDLSLERPESAGDVDVIGLAQPRPDSRVIRALRHADRGQGGKPVFSFDEEFHAERFHLFPQIFSDRLMADPAVFQPLFENEPKSFAQSVMQGGRPLGPP